MKGALDVRRDIEKILDSTHDAMIVVDKNGLITLFNKSAERLTGKKSKNALGKPVEDIIETTRLPIILKTGLSELNQQQKLGETTIVTNRMPILDDDGNVTGAVAIFRDVSDLLELVDQITNLSEIKQTLEAIINATQDAISVVDSKGYGLMINPAYTKMTGFRKEDIVGKDCTVDLAEGESVHKYVLKTGNSVRGKKLLVGPNRKEVIAEAAPIVVGHSIIGSVAVIHDLTELNEIYRKLDQAKKIIRNLEAKYTFDDIIGHSDIINNTILKAKMAAITPATVVLRGESGTGKELFAHAIHNASNRKNAQFVRVNCAAINENLLESELFGYEEGAFTGASKGGKIGLFENANGGTLFLDEIGEMSLNTQAKLLRVLQEKEVLRVGGNKPIPIDVRIITATNIDLEIAVKNKKFRLDLYYRLNVFPIDIPPLRAHKEDIPELVNNLVIKYNQEYGRSITEITDDVYRKLMIYDWPGNIRELENFIGRSMINIKMNESTINLSHLPLINEIDPVENFEREENLIIKGSPLVEQLAEYEKKIIHKVLKSNDNNREDTAKDLKISLRTLYYKIKQYNL